MYDREFLNLNSGVKETPHMFGPLTTALFMQTGFWLPEDEAFLAMNYLRIMDARTIAATVHLGHFSCCPLTK